MTRAPSQAHQSTRVTGTQSSPAQTVTVRPRQSPIAEFRAGGRVRARRRSREWHGLTPATQYHVASPRARIFPTRGLGFSLGFGRRGYRQRRGSAVASPARGRIQVGVADRRAKLEGSLVDRRTTVGRVGTAVAGRDHGRGRVGPGGGHGLDGDGRQRRAGARARTGATRAAVPGRNQRPTSRRAKVGIM